MTKPPSKLGRGLSALMAEIAVPEEAEIIPDTPETAPEGLDKKTGIFALPIDKLIRNPDQPRRHFDKAQLEELSRSIADKGVLQPILVRPIPPNKKAEKSDGHYQIVAGERRWQAALKAGLTHMPALVRDLSDRDVLEIGVVENVQRADLSPIEEAMAYQALRDQFGRKQDEIAQAIGKSRSHVANCIRLLQLPKLAHDFLQAGTITAGHARAILSAPDPKALTEAIVDKGLSVRQAEDWVKTSISAARQSKAKDKPADDRGRMNADTRAIERELTDFLGLKVSLNHKNPGGKISISYKTLEQLDDLIRRLRKS
mgnify:CR=1 FL=1